MSKKRRARNKTQSNEFASNRQGFVTAVAWYQADQWQQLLDVSSDRDKLEDRYEEWLASATKMVAELKGMGVDVDLMDVDIDELVRWRKVKGKKVDGPARSHYVAEKLREKHRTTQ